MTYLSTYFSYPQYIDRRNSKTMFISSTTLPWLFELSSLTCHCTPQFDASKLLC